MTSATPVGSVVIPAWNEEGVIDRTLRALLADVDDGVLEVVVACNGCTDATVAVASAAAPSATVIDLPDPGKAGAIRAAEARTTTLPRLYLDADVPLPGPSALQVLAALHDGAVAARPPFEYDTAGASRIVRRYYRQRARLVGVAGELCGAGVYGLSATARARFDEFPDVVADDLFAARVVERDEVTIVPCDPVPVAVPRDVRSLVRTLTRVHRGNRELARRLPDRAARTTRATVDELVRSVSRPADALDALVYAVLVALGRLGARRPSATWGRDDTTRTVTA